MDKDFTKKIGDWLQSPAESRDWEEGALMVLRLSGNRILYNNIMARIDYRHDVIEYQLQKYYNFRVKELTRDQVNKMAEKAEKIVKEYADVKSSKDNPKPKGKRDDHDSLPDEIKAKFVENLSILQKIRELHLKLRSLSLDNAPCPDSERFPFLQEIIKLDKKYHANWKDYDSYSNES